MICIGRASGKRDGLHGRETWHASCPKGLLAAVFYSKPVVHSPPWSGRGGPPPAGANVRFFRRFQSPLRRQAIVPPEYYYPVVPPAPRLVPQQAAQQGAHISPARER